MESGGFLSPFLITSLKAFFSFSFSLFFSSLSIPFPIVSTAESAKRECMSMKPCAAALLSRFFPQ